MASNAPEAETKTSPVVAAEPAGPRLWERAADALLAIPIALLAEVGTMARLAYETVRWMARPPYRGRQLVDAMEFIGVQSIFIVGLTGTFVGAVFGLQLVDSLRDFGAESQTGSIVSVALARELGPVFAALMVSSRAGSAIATELGSMRVTNQIDALTTMSVSPVQYLIVPRVIAGFTMVPALALVFDLVGYGGAYFVAVKLFGLDGGVFEERARWFVEGSDLAQGLVKAAVFGIAVTMIACRQGYYATGGAAGVGQATNRAVVQSAVAVLLLDYVVTAIFLGQGG
ncbi:MlaE family ABC transporter permease [Sandaracinus amylolyticus]|uniref:MlaE family ABC transporter permease n=1 Tax=Sandaracinus amylolyticus TaxID=927083 RepID=UPI001F26850E|nr:ABC transporter permease [Sandaracinus amylolyticus]UJR81590.1 ABC amino acid transporter, inner membrane subunit [Sandaracinus amylolyticus]